MSETDQLVTYLSTLSCRAHREATTVSTHEMGVTVTCCCSRFATIVDVECEYKIGALRSRNSPRTALPRIIITVKETALKQS